MAQFNQQWDKKVTVQSIKTQTVCLKKQIDISENYFKKNPNPYSNSFKSYIYTYRNPNPQYNQFKSYIYIYTLVNLNFIGAKSKKKIYPIH